MFYRPGQARVLFPYWPTGVEWFIVGGPADGNEAQTVVERYPGVKCAGFEPNLEYVRFQEEHGFPGLLYPCALWDKNETLTFSLPTTLPRSGSVCRDLTGLSTTTSEVPARRLDSLLPPDLHDNLVLWLDVEHAEGAALRGAEGLLKQGKVLLLNVEVWDETFEEIDKLLASFGYAAVHTWGRTVRDKRDVVYSKVIPC